MNSFHTAEKERGEPGILCRLTAKHELLGSHQVIHGFCLYQVNQRSFVYTRPSTSAGYTRSSTSSCCQVVIKYSSFIPGHQQSFVYTRSPAISCLYQGEASYSHQWPRCGERFFGRYTPEERFLGRLRVWHLGERDPRLWDDSGQRVSSSRPVSGMSNIVGGHSTRLRAAASGGAASNSSSVSGRSASGSGNIRPGLEPPAILASLSGSVKQFCSSPEGYPEKEFCGVCWRAGKERPDPEKESR